MERALKSDEKAQQVNEEALKGDIVVLKDNGEAATGGAESLKRDP